MKPTFSTINKLLLLIILEGISILIWQTLEPSETQSRFFLFYSLARWGLILFNLGFVFLFALLLQKIKREKKWIESHLNSLNEEKYAGKILAIISIIFLFLAGGIIWFSQQDKFYAYYLELRPLLLLVLTTITQILIFYILKMRHTLKRIGQKYIPTGTPSQIYAISSKKRFLALLAISFFYLILQIYAHLDIREAASLGDTTSYLEGASFSLKDPAFFRERRPWGIALAYKILGRSLIAIDLAQVLVSTLSWLSLAWIFSRSLKKSWGKIISFFVILGFSLSPTVQVWNHSALSESFTISFTILILSLTIALAQEWRKGFYILLFPLFIIWMSLHEINLYIGILVAIAFFVAGVFQEKYRFLWGLSLLIGIVFIINAQLSAAYALPRWGLPLAEVTTKRILPNKEFLDFFAKHGMPISSELMAFSGEWANTKNYAIINTPALKPFSVWLFAHGKTVYAKFLYTHPIYTITAPFKDLEILLATNFENFIPKYVSPLPKIVNAFFYQVRFFWLYFWVSLTLIMLTIKRNYVTNKTVFWVVFTFWIISIPYLYLTWHGDAHSVFRHAVIANIQFHLGVWLLLLLNLNPQKNL